MFASRYKAVVPSNYPINLIDVSVAENWENFSWRYFRIERRAERQERLEMFLNPWYLQQQAAKVEQADQHNQNTINLNMEEEKMESSPSPLSSQESGVVKEREETQSASPSPAPSVLSAGSCGSGNQNNPTNLQQLQLTNLQSSLKPGWTVHITPEGRLYYCK